MSTNNGRVMHAAWQYRINRQSFGRYWDTVIAFMVIISLAVANLQFVIP
jgi:hypothetical protein